MKHFHSFIFGVSINFKFSESKVLQYFDNMRHNSAALNVSVEVVKVTYHTGLLDAKLTWYWVVLLAKFASIIWRFLFHSVWIHKV